MKKIHYNKLIRDKVAAGMKKRGVAFVSRKLNRKEFERALIKKVEEEAGGLEKAGSREELIAEIADVLDVIEEVKKLKKIRPSEIAAAQQENKNKKGGFKKRLFLVWSADTGYRTNERRYLGK